MIRRPWRADPVVRDLKNRKQAAMVQAETAPTLEGSEAGSSAWWAADDALRAWKRRTAPAIEWAKVRIGAAARRRRDRRRFAEARTLDELAELTARWLEGHLVVCANYGGPADPETSEIRDTLIRFNRAGALTTQSQPGCTGRTYTGALFQQRASVMFHAPDTERGHDLLDALQAAGITVATRRDEWLTDSRPHPWDGSIRPPRTDDLCISRAAAEDVEDAVAVAAVDPQWGRADSPLWAVLDQWSAAAPSKAVCIRCETRIVGATECPECGPDDLIPAGDVYFAQWWDTTTEA